MKQEARHESFSGKVVILGFGSVGQGILPLLPRSLGVKPDRIRIIKANEDKSGIAARYGAEVIAAPLNEGNFEAVL